MSVARSTKLLHSAISFCYLLIILSYSLASTTSFVPLRMLASTCPPAHVATMSTCWSSHSTVFLLDPSHLSQWQQLDVLVLLSCVVLWLLSCIFPPGSRYSWYFPTRLLGISRDSTWVSWCWDVMACVIHAFFLIYTRFFLMFTLFLQAWEQQKSQEPWLLSWDFANLGVYYLSLV